MKLLPFGVRSCRVNGLREDAGDLAGFLMEIRVESDTAITQVLDPVHLALSTYFAADDLSTPCVPYFPTLHFT